MTKTRWLLTALVAGVLLAPVARAHDEKMDGDWTKGKMAKDLMLTPEQSAKLKVIHEDQMKAQKPLWEQMDGQLMELKSLVDSKAPDDQLAAKLDQIKATHDQIDMNMKNFKAQKDAVLTVMQRAKLKLMMHKMVKDMVKDHKKGMKEEHGKGM